MAGAITVQQWAISLDQFGKGLARPDQVLMQKLSVALVADVKENFDRSADPTGKPWLALAFPRASGGSKPLLDKGLLRASVTGRVTGNTVIVGTNRPGASLHQLGGTIRPKRVKWLTIPKTREAARHRARDFPRKLAAIFGKTGGVLIDKKTDIVQYVLTKEVKVPARPFIGIGPRGAARVLRIIQDHLAKPLTA